MSKSFKSKFTVLFGCFLLLIITGCTTADLYRLNYPDDPVMQDRMEKEYGNEPLWQTQTA